MWYFLMAMIAVLALGCCTYLTWRLRKCYTRTPASKRARVLAWVIPAGAVGIVALVLCLTINYINAAVSIVAIVLLWLICSAVCCIINKAAKKKIPELVPAIISVVLAAVYLGVGSFFAYYVYETKYELTTDKAVSLRIVQFADSHIGATFDADGFSAHVDDMNAANPDIVFITGDFVDDGTDRADMLGSCAALKKFDAPLGVYFVYGNHDIGYFSETTRGWTKAEFEAALTDAGVVILDDAAVAVGDINIIGRRDGSATERGIGRKALTELTADVDMSRYTIVLDHQPREYDKAAAAGVDLVLSGHTHGGQMIPINFVIMASNDRVYGHEQRNNTDFIVTSGISDWEMIFKNFCISEYVVIDINKSI